MTPKSTAKTALFAGSFSPFTAGHADIVSRGLELFDHIIIGVGINPAKAKETDTEAILSPIRELYAADTRVSVEAYSCLTVDFAQQSHAQYLLRGVRNVRDFEYERDLADLNSKLSGIETVILFSRPELAAISSSVIRELRSYGHDITPFMP